MQLNGFDSPQNYNTIGDCLVCIKGQGICHKDPLNLKCISYSVSNTFKIQVWCKML